MKIEIDDSIMSSILFCFAACLIVICICGSILIGTKNSHEITKYALENGYEEAKIDGMNGVYWRKK